MHGPCHIPSPVISENCRREHKGWVNEQTLAGRAARILTNRRSPKSRKRIKLIATGVENASQKFRGSTLLPSCLLRRQPQSQLHRIIVKLLIIPEVKIYRLVHGPPHPRILRKTEDPGRASARGLLLLSDFTSRAGQLAHYPQPMPPPRLPAVHVNMKLGLWLSPSRQSVIGYNDSTGIRCSVRTYGPHYAPSLVLSNEGPRRPCWSYMD